MNSDLETTLEELGPGYREMVGRMKGAFAEPSAAGFRWRGYLTAAGVIAVAALSFVFGRMAGAGSASGPGVCAARAICAENEYLLAHLRGDGAVEEMIRTQRPDGGWGNDFLTRQNASALSRSDMPGARIAARKAMRNLRLKGVL